MNLDKPTALRAFNTLFFSFVDDIITLFPNNSELLVAKKTFESIKTLNVSIIIKVWFQQVYLPYSQKIFEGDLSYFLEKDYEDDLNSLPNVKEVMQTIDSFRHKINIMSVENQKTSLDYLKRLSVLSQCYHNS
jgi:hypothetical protein